MRLHDRPSEAPSTASTVIPRGWTGPAVGPDEDRRLLRLARSAIAAILGGRPLDPAAASLPPVADAPLGAFVTLTIDGELRGCMGRLDFEQPLRENLVAAAESVTRDPRFAPLAPAELASIRVEISLIAPPVELPDPSAFDAQRHGILVERGFRGAILLPQVAQERGWDERTTLEAVCSKAGLPRDAWREPGTRLSVFVTHSACESEPAPA